MPLFSTDRTKETVTIRTAELELAFSLEDGGLRLLRRVDGPSVLGHGGPRPSVDVRLNGEWLARRVFVRYLRHTIDERDGAPELVIVIGIGPLIVYDRYRIEGALITRRVSVENVGEDPVQLHGVRLELPWVRIDSLESCRFEAPGTSVRPHVALAVAAEQREDVLPRRFFAPGLRDGRAMEPAPTYTPGLMAVCNGETDETLLCWFLSATAPAHPQVEGNGEAVTLQHQIELADWLRAEVALSGGTQYIMLVREPWAQALSAFRRAWQQSDALAAPPEPAGWLCDAAIYETHPALFGGFRDMVAALPGLAALGISALCLMPIWSYAGRRARLWDGNWEAAGDLYAVRDMAQLDATLGDPDDLRALVEAAHAQGMRVIVDLPLIGCAPDARYLNENPEWICRDEHGLPARAPGRPTIVSFDWANASLRDYLVGEALAQLRAYDLDGYRAITPRAVQPNWARGLPYQSGAGSLGFLRALEVLRREMRAIKPEAALLSDLSGPFGAIGYDGAVDELTHHMFVHLALNRISPAELGDWLEDHWGALPAAVPRISFTESHRTRLINPLAEGLRGSRISRMLLAGIVLCGFVPLIWSGQEDDERQFVARLLQVRREYPVLRYGAVRCNAVPCNSPQVFAVLRHCGEARLLGLLNVGPNKQIVMLSLPIDILDLPAADYALRELLTDRLWREDARSVWQRDELLELSLTIEPFSAYYFALEPA